MPRIIAFTGRAQAGKTTCADYLSARHGYVRVSFAAPLKRMLAALTDETDKAAACPELCGKTIREALQTLGTEWGRDMIGADLWLRQMQRTLARIGDARIVCDDVRFDNEADLFLAMGARVIRVDKPSDQPWHHRSEAGVNATLIHAAVCNSGTILELHTALEKTLAMISA